MPGLKPVPEWQSPQAQSLYQQELVPAPLLLTPPVEHSRMLWHLPAQWQ